MALNREGRLKRYAEAVAMADRGEGPPHLDEIVRLLREGLPGTQIAKRLGLSRSLVYQHLDDPTGEAVNARKRKVHGTCVDCGVPTFNSGSVPGERCLTCQQTLNLDRNTRIIELWEEGAPVWYIAEELGLGEGVVGSAIQTMREQGFPISLHRRRNRELWRTIQRKWNAGKSSYTIAEEIGDISEQGVHQQIRAMRAVGWTMRSGYPRERRKRVAA